MYQMMNGKALKFRAHAEQRVSTVLRTIRRIGNLSRRASYDFTPEQVDKIFAAIRAELDAAEVKFASADKTTRQLLFRLD